MDRTFYDGEMRFAWICLMVLGMICSLSPGALSYEVIPAVIDVEAGGGSSQILLRGAGAENIEEVQVLANGKQTSYLLARTGGKAAGQVTVVIYGREDAPRNVKYTLAVDSRVLPLKIRVVNPGEAKNTGRVAASNQDIREVVLEANTGQIVVSANQAPQVLRTIPSPLMVAPDGLTKRVLLLGKRLEAIDDVRVRKADQPPKYRGKQGQLPFTYREGMLEVELMASRKTKLGEQYVLDLMVGKFKAFSVGFEIGEPAMQPVESVLPEAEGPLTIELPDSASSGAVEQQ
ncbi:MAG: hypothetical protein AAF571_04665 [Verrucomicrobiota bacterium]